MKNPESIIADIVRNMNNIKNGNHTITDWLKLMGTKKDSTISSKNNVVDTIINEVFDEEENLLKNQFEEDIIEDLDEIKDYNDIIDF
jgi:hypothetical protein